MGEGRGLAAGFPCPPALATIRQGCTLDLDLLQIIYGLALLATGLVALPAPPLRLPWRYWGLAGIAAGLARLCVVFRPELVELGTVKALLVMCSGLLLVEAGRRVLGLRWAWAIHMGLIALTATLFLATPFNLAASAAAGCALPGFIASATAWWRLQRERSGLVRVGHLLIALVFTFWALALGAVLLSGHGARLGLEQGWYIAVFAALSLLLFVGFLIAVTADLPAGLGRSRARLVLATGVGITLLMLAGWGLAEAHDRRSHQAVMANADLQARAVATFLDAQHATGALAARLVAEWSATRRVLIAAGDRDRLDRLLAEEVQRQGLAIAYVLDSEGVVLCSSNRGAPDDLVGHSFAWRPYFQDALAGGQGSMWARGAVTVKRGCYHAAPVRDAEGNILGVAAIKQDAEALDRFLAQYRHCQVLDPTGGVFAASPGVEHLETHGDGETVLGDRRFLVRGTADEALPWRIVMLQDLSALQHERRVILASAAVLALLLLAAQGVIAVHLDRRHGLAALAEQLQRVFEANQDAYWDWDLSGGSLYVSDRWFTMLGWSPDALPATYATWTELLHPEDRGSVIQAVEAAVADGQPFTQVFRLRRRDGGWTWIESRGKVVSRDSSGSAVRVAGTHTDITARREAEERLQEALARAEDGARAKSAFLANMSHEIRTPLNGVLGMTELLLTTPLDQVQSGYARTILRSGQGLLTLLNDVLDLARIEAGRMRLADASFDVHQLVADVVALHRARLDPGRVELRCEVGSGVPQWLRGDPDRLRQVLGNLLGNAVKFTHDGAVSVRVVRAGDRLLLTISDTGIGIPAERLAELFRPFTQADVSTTRRYGGSGLGLAICRQLCVLMGGSITLDSIPGRGTTCLVELPCVPGGPAAVPPAAPTSQASAAGLAVLVVEDQPVNQEIARLMLERLGATVQVAEDGEQALAALAARRFDLVFMDCHLPGMDGYHTTARIRERESGRSRVPIIAMTADALPGDRERCLLAGMDDHLSKPVGIAALSAAIARHHGAEAPAPPEPAEAQVLDLELSEGIRRLSPGNALRLLATFIAELPQRRQAVATDLAGGDLEGAQRRLHAWKGTAGCLGAKALRDSLDAVEMALRSGEHDAARARWREVEVVLDATGEALSALAERWRRERPA